MVLKARTGPTRLLLAHKATPERRVQQARSRPYPARRVTMAAQVLKARTVLPVPKETLVPKAFPAHQVQLLARRVTTAEKVPKVNPARKETRVTQAEQARRAATERRARLAAQERRARQVLRLLSLCRQLNPLHRLSATFGSTTANVQGAHVQRAIVRLDARRR